MKGITEKKLIEFKKNLLSNFGIKNIVFFA